jgi:hypothetical protein
VAFFSHKRPVSSQLKTCSGLYPPSSIIFANVNGNNLAASTSADALPQIFFLLKTKSCFSEVLYRVMRTLVAFSRPCYSETVLSECRVKRGLPKFALLFLNFSPPLCTLLSVEPIMQDYMKSCVYDKFVSIIIDCLLFAVHLFQLHSINFLSTLFIYFIQFEQYQHLK